MAKLSLGGKPIKAKLVLGVKFPKGWQAANPIWNFVTGGWEDRGMVWIGQEKATMADVKRLREVFGPKVKVDGNSKRGKKNPKYNTFESRNRGKGPYKNPGYVAKK